MKTNKQTVDSMTTWYSIMYWIQDTFTKYTTHKSTAAIRSAVLTPLTHCIHTTLYSSWNFHFSDANGHLHIEREIRPININREENNDVNENWIIFMMVLCACAFVCCVCLFYFRVDFCWKQIMYWCAILQTVKMHNQWICTCKITI